MTYLTQMSPRKTHAIRSLTLIASIYIVARMAGWTGPDTQIDWDPGLMYPAIAIITLWGIARMTRRW
jgi:hypothetical protein